MKISKQDNSNHTAFITIELKPEDYQPKVEEVIKKYQKTATVKGFRPGKVPTGVIKKMYGKSVLIEELNRLLGKELTKYIYDNKIDVLGTPLPKFNEDEQLLNDGQTFEFKYEVGLAPSFELKMPSQKIPYYLIKVEDKMIDDEVANIRRRYGKFSQPEVSDEHSILYGEFSELDGMQAKEGGVSSTTTISLEMISQTEQAAFLGKKKDDIIEFNPLKTFRSEAEVSSMLRLKKEDEAMKSDYSFKILTVNNIEKAELNEELFEKNFPGEEIKTEEEFRLKIKQGVQSFFEKESDKKLNKDLRNSFLEVNSMELPDDFLKRMLRVNSDKKSDEHQFEHEYFHAAEDLKWNLIQTKISDEQKITVAKEEVTELAKRMVIQQYSQYGVPAPEEESLNEISSKYISEDDNFEKLERMLRSEKIFEYLKKTVKLDINELLQKDFIEKLHEKTLHEQEHHSHA